MTRASGERREGRGGIFDTRSATCAARNRARALSRACEEKTMMRGHRMTTRLLVVALLFGLLVSVPLAGAPVSARQDEQLQIVFSVPGLNFPFFVHMMNIARDKAAEMDIELIEQDGQNDSATQSAG